jgi:hypothetical protein
MANCNCGCDRQGIVRVRYQRQPPKCVARTVYHSVPQPPLRIIETYEKVNSIVQGPCTSNAPACGGCHCRCGY